MTVATPWKRSRRPNAFVNFSNPSKSTKITDVRLTYTPIVEPKVDLEEVDVVRVGTEFSRFHFEKLLRTFGTEEISMVKLPLCSGEE